MYKDGELIGDLLQGPDEHNCVLIRTSTLLEILLDGELPDSIIERTFNDPEVLCDCANTALEEGKDVECFELASAYNDAVSHYDECSVMNTEVAYKALCLGRYALAERLSDELLVDWDLLDDEELETLQGDDKSYKLVKEYGCNRIRTVWCY